MTRLISVMVLSLTVVVGLNAKAQATEVGNGRNFGLGIQFGDPTAIVGKYFIGRGNAIDFGLGFGGYGYYRCHNSRGWYDCNDGYGHNFSLHADYLWQQNLVHQQAKLDWHIGGGARIDFWGYRGGDNGADVIVRMPIGLDLSFDRPNFLEVFFEVVPGIIIVPPAWPDLDADIGVRFFF